jgi:hypothetical protein
MELKVCSDLKLKLELKVRPKLGVGSTAGNHGSLVNRPKVSGGGNVHDDGRPSPHTLATLEVVLSSLRTCFSSSLISSFHKLLKLSALLRP